LAGQAVTDHPMARIINQTITSPPWLRFAPLGKQGAEENRTDKTGGNAPGIV
jgi:hypothetical protein